MEKDIYTYVYAKEDFQKKASEWTEFSQVFSIIFIAQKQQQQQISTIEIMYDFN